MELNNNPNIPNPQPQPQYAPPQPRPQQFAQPGQAPQYAQQQRPQQFAQPGMPPQHAQQQRPQQFAQPGQAPQYAQQPGFGNVPPQPPVMQLATDRSLLKYILLSLITFGIYGIVAMYKATEDLNTIASKYDGKKTMNFLLMALLVTPVTCGIYGIIWYHTFSDRIGAELQRRGIQYSFNSSTFWLWNVLGSFIFVGPFVYVHKMFEALNLLSEDYNKRG